MHEEHYHDTPSSRQASKFFFNHQTAVQFNNSSLLFLTLKFTAASKLNKKFFSDCTWKISLLIKVYLLHSFFTLCLKATADCKKKQKNNNLQDFLKTDPSGISLSNIPVLGELFPPAAQRTPSERDVSGGG